MVQIRVTREMWSFLVGAALAILGVTHKTAILNHAAVGFAGAVAMVGPDALGGLGTGLAAQLACLAAALSYAFASIFGRRFKRMGVTPLATAAGQVCASTLLLLLVMLLVDRPWTLAMPGAVTWGAVLGVGLLSTALAYVLYFRILAAAGATNLLLVTFLIPVSAILLGVLVLGETLLPRHLAGMALIGAGLAFIDGRLPRLLLRRRPVPPPTTRPASKPGPISENRVG